MPGDTSTSAGRATGYLLGCHKQLGTFMAISNMGERVFRYCVFLKSMTFAWMHGEIPHEHPHPDTILWLHLLGVENYVDSFNAFLAIYSR